MIFVVIVAMFLIVSGLFITYIAVGLARTQERRICEERIAAIRKLYNRRSP